MGSHGEEISYAIVGRSVPKIDAVPKATGSAQYAADLALSRMLCGKILRSPHPHARLLNIDTSKAQRVPGVKGIITGQDILPRKYGIVPFAADEYALAIEKVRYVGDEIAAVAAVDEDSAEEALDCIKVEYELLPAVFDPEEAMQAGAPVIHDGTLLNVSAQILKEWGDVEAAFTAADYVREDRYVTQAVGHAPLEPHASIASWEDGKLTIWASTQIPFYLRRNLANTLGMPDSKIRVIKPVVGGGFGGKLDMFAHDFCTSLLSLKTGRPVQIVHNREESLAATRGRHPMVIRLKTGVQADGSIVAQSFKVIADGGAYNSTAPLMITVASIFVMIPYILPNLKFEACHVYTNKMTKGAMRGHGVPQIRFAAEAQLETIAAEIGMDSVALRLKNAIHANQPHPGGLIIKSCGFGDSVEAAAKQINWDLKRNRGQAVSQSGVGMGCSAFASGANNMSHAGSSAIVKIERDGLVTLLTGAADIGQGSDSVLAQIVAEELGVSLQDVRITAADTELTPHDPGTFGSGVTFRAGNAARFAAANARQKLFKVIATKWDVAPDDLSIREGRVYPAGAPQQGITFTQALKQYQYSGAPFPLIGEGFYSIPGTEPTTLITEAGNLSAAYSFGAQTAEVKIDQETGEIKVVKIVTAHDCGFAINPMAVEGQLEGSIAGGLGQALFEDFPLSNGAALNASFLDYKLPTAMDMPAIESIAIDTHDPGGPFGAKEAGEGSLVFTIPAIANAVSNALGAMITELPITPERVLNIIERRGIKTDT